MCWASGTIGRDAPEALTAASYFVATTGLGCRALNEVLKITNGALVWGPVNPKTGVHRWVRLDEQWVCKNRVGDRARQTAAQVTADDENPETCMVRTLMALRERKTDAQNAPKARLLWNISPHAKANPNKFSKWYKHQPLGKNQLSKVFTDALVSAGIDPVIEGYKLSSTRKVLVEGALDSGMPETMVGKLAGQRSNEAKASYVERKDITTRAATIAVSRAGAGLTANYQEILKKVQAEDQEEIEAMKRGSGSKGGVGIKGAGDSGGKVKAEMDEDETNRKQKRSGREEDGEEMRQENKRLRQILIQQQAQLKVLKSDEGQGPSVGSAKQEFHPALTVQNNRWGQNVFQSHLRESEGWAAASVQENPPFHSNHNSSSWQHPTGFVQQGFLEQGQQNMRVELLRGASGQPSFFQQPASPFGHQQPQLFYGQQRPDRNMYLGNAPSQVCQIFIVQNCSGFQSFTMAGIAVFQPGWKISPGHSCPAWWLSAWLYGIASATGLILPLFRICALILLNPITGADDSGATTWPCTQPSSRIPGWSAVPGMSLHFNIP